jgi:hypothetical protein
LSASSRCGSTHSALPEAARRRILLVERSRVGGVWRGGDDRGGVVAAAWTPLRSLQSTGRIIVPSLIVFGGGFASLAWLTPQIWQLYLTFFALGLVANGTAQMAYSRAISTWFDRYRGRALSRDCLKSSGDA